MGMVNINDYHTLVEIAKRHDPDGNSAELIDIMSKGKPILEEAHWEEANDFTSHKYTQIIEKPRGQWASLNSYIPFTSGRTRQAEEPIKMIKDMSEIDIDMLEIARSPEKYIADENKMHVSGMGDHIHEKVFYGNGLINPDEPTGFATRHNSLSQSNVFSNGGSGSNLTSIHIIKWGRDGVYLVHPRGGKKILEEGKPKRELLQVTEDGVLKGKYSMVTPFKFKFGICIADPRCYIRICNVETTGEENIFESKLLINILENFPNTDNIVIYVSKSVKAQINNTVSDKTNVNFRPEQAWGRPVTHFLEIPVKRCDGISDAESQVA